MIDAFLKEENANIICSINVYLIFELWRIREKREQKFTVFRVIFRVNKKCIVWTENMIFYRILENSWLKKNVIVIESIDWLIYSFIVLTSNMSTSYESIYWCLYRKTLRRKKTHIFRFLSIAFRSSFEVLSTHINLMSFFTFYFVIFWYVSLIITV